jgi:uncharacterized protein (DUF58 family)
VTVGLTRTGLGVSLLGAGAVSAGVALGQRGLVAVGAALVAAVGAGLLSIAGRHPGGRRSLESTRVDDGRRAPALLTLGRPPRRRWFRPGSTVRDSVAGAPVEVPLPDAVHAGPRRAAAVVYDLPAVGRGCHRLGPAHVERCDALGLARVRWRIEGDRTLRVHPRVHALRQARWGRAEDDDGSGGVATRRGGTSFHALRDYEPGDDVRLIHWASTARAGGLQVRDVVAVDDADVLVVLDTAADAHTDRGGFEDAVRVAASVVLAAGGDRRPVRLRTTGGLDRFVAPTPAGRLRALDELAAVTITTGAAGLATVTRGGTGALVVVTGDGPRAVAGGVGPLVRRHDSVTLVQVGPRAVARRVAVPGVRTLAGATSGEVADRWNGEPPT